MIDVATLKIGDRVCYNPSYNKSLYQNGRVKEIPEHTNKEVRVVYHCGGDWDNFMDYTSALTSIDELQKGWNHDIPKEEVNEEIL